jgi:4a-hydroxytetrahydrobiopterin dehydratase
MDDGIRVSDFHAAEGTADFRVVGDGALAFYPTGSLAESARLVAAIAALPGIEDHRPDLDVRGDGVTVRLLTRNDAWYGMSRRDVAAAAAISGVARALGLVADTRPLQSVLVIPGAPDAPGIMPFWQAALGYVRRPDSPAEDLVDPRDRGPALWFEGMDAPRADGGGGAIHVAVWVPEEGAAARIEATVAAGGRVVRDRAPAWVTLADAAGNEIDIATTGSRD